MAVEHGVCIRPGTGQADRHGDGESVVVDVPCWATFAAKCPLCAEKGRRVRVVQCWEGWHLDHETDLTRDDPTGRDAPRSCLVEVTWKRPPAAKPAAHGARCE